MMIRALSLRGAIGGMLVLLAALARPATAQVFQPHLTLSGFAGAALWDDKVNLENAPVFGGRVGLLAGRSVLFGLEGTYSLSNLDTSHGPWPFVPTQPPTPSPADPTAPVEEDFTHWGLDAIITVPWRIAPYILGGWTEVRFENDDPSWGDNSYHGWEFALGAKMYVSPRVAVRLEARDVMFEFDNPPAAPGDGTSNWFLTAGLDFAIGGAAVAKDADFDGVIDDIDACLGTPLGAFVDARGCPLDQDNDGVWDGLDACINTAVGAIVDEHGCPRDADLDGVPDGIDQCDSTARGFPVDARGCPRDLDGDGVLDGADLCPDTPVGALVDVRGCPLDQDRDGVPDGIDQCPDTRPGARVNAKGCPNDSDGDGVPDGVDKCPMTPANVRVDKDGCPIEVSEKEVELLDTGKITVHNILFETNKADLKAASGPVIQEIGAILAQWPDLRIEIGGHADARGTDDYNRTLSQKRAQAVLDRLLAEYPQLPAGNYVAKGYGESQPIATNDTAVGMAKNRRVEFRS
jgi:outer membrane protein OmpA-like peptidoglycan-associated protein